MASSPISSWHIDREKVEAVTDFIFLDSKITVDGECGHEIKDTCSKARQCIKKQKYFVDKGLYIVKNMVFQ